MPKRLLHPALGDLLLLIAVPLLHFAVYAHSYPEHDTYYVFQSFKTVYESLLHGGGFPQWLPKIQYGTPSLVYVFPTLTPAQYATAYALAPLGYKNLLYAFQFSVALEILVFLAGCRLLAGRLFETRAAAAFLVLSAGLLTVHQQQIWYNLRIVELLPLLLALIHRFAADRRPEDLTAAALVAMLWLVGNIFYFLPIALLLVGLALAVFVLPGWRRRPALDRAGLQRPLFWVLAVTAVVAAGMLVVVARHVFDDVSLHSPFRQESGRTSVDIFLTYGRNLDLLKFAELFLVVPNNPDSLLFVGLVNLVFAVCALRLDRRRRGWPFLLIGGVFAAMSLPGLLPVARLLYALVPGMEYFRHIGLMMAIPRFCLLVLAAIGVDALLTAGGTAERRLTGAVAVGAVAVAGVLLATLGFSYTAYPLAALLPDFPPEFGPPTQVVAIPLAAAAVLAAVLLRSGTRGTAPWWPLGLAAVELLAYFHFMYWATASRNPGEISGFFKAAEPRFVATRTREPEGGDLALLGFYGPYYPLEAMMRGERCLDVGRRDARTVWMARLVDARGGVPIRPGEKAEPRPDDAALMRVLGCGTPKLRVVRDVRVVPSDAEALDYARRSPDFGQTPVLVCPPDQAACPGRPAEADAAADAPAPVVEAAGANAVRLRAGPPGDPGGWLVYADAWAPGWEALVDGQPQPVRRADVAFKAVFLPPGEHTVEFRYRSHPRMFAGYHGLMLVSIGFGLLGVLQAWRRARAVRVPV